ncbi:MAG: hypothetical protein RL722_2084 [Pseudomonadota bacterium]|jgi:ABC-type transport system substrate-binding protein
MPRPYDALPDRPDVTGTDPADPGRRPWLGAAVGLAGLANLPASLAAPARSLAVGPEPVFARAAPPRPPGPRKLLKVAFRSAETTFDPARITDLYSRAITTHIFEALYAYDYLARPAEVVPLTAAALPEVSKDFRTWTISLKRGIYFADDPAFGGQPRELVAADYAYSLKRIVDPANKSSLASNILEEGILGLEALQKAAISKKKPFDYDAPLPGIEVLDRYTLRFRLAEGRPRFLYTLADSSSVGAVAREVVQRYGQDVGAHPVGTGPFRLAEWRRSSLIRLERNPGFREQRYAELAHPRPDDAAGQAILARHKDRLLPMVDAVEVAIIEESQPLWLAFLNEELDSLATTASALPAEFVDLAAPGGTLAPHLARRGVELHRELRSDVTLTYFNMDDPVVGGYTPEKVALRRAMSLAYDVGREIEVMRKRQAVRAHSIIPPACTGYDPAFVSPQSEYDPARARALLDLYGYVDRNGDGWRELPDGSPLEITRSTEPEQIYRVQDEIWRSSLKAVGIRLKFDIQQWPTHLKQAEAGQLQMWSLGNSASSPDGLDGLAYLYGPQAGQYNLARFRNKTMDQLYERLKGMPDGPERERLFVEAKRLVAAWLPYRFGVHRISVELLHPWVKGYRRPAFGSRWFHMVDLDPERRKPT